MAFSSHKTNSGLNLSRHRFLFVLLAFLLPSIAFSKGMKGFDEDDESAPYNLPNLITTWSGWDDDCRIKKDEEACQNRAQVESMINENGYCRFKSLEWRKCSSPGTTKVVLPDRAAFELQKSYDNCKKGDKDECSQVKRHVDGKEYCLSKTERVSKCPSAPISADVHTLIKEDTRLADRCQGSDDSNACDLRNALDRKLQKLGWCNGKEGQITANYKWHKCVGNSLRIN
jgi:hypothetical protein